MREDRRRFLAQGVAGLTLSALGWCAAPTIARAAPHYSFRFGQNEIIVLSDGHLTMPTPFLATNVTESELHAALAGAARPTERVEPPCNITLVRTPSDVILIDTGAGAHFMPPAGKLMAALEAASIQPASVTKVVFTHAHPDHLWGTLDDFDDSPNFPNATYVIAAAEWNFWSAEDVDQRMPQDRVFFVAPTRRILKKIKEQVRTIYPGDDIVPGIRALDTAGHTAGHIAIEIVAGNEALVVVGDALAHPLIAFAHPDWRPAADHHDADRAVATRKRLLDLLATERSRLIGYHLPFPGVGWVERKGSAYLYVPAA